MRRAPLLVPATLAPVILPWLVVGLSGVQEGGASPRTPEAQAPAVRLRPAATPQSLVAPGPAPDLEILFSSEVEGHYQPCG